LNFLITDIFWQCDLSAYLFATNNIVSPVFWVSDIPWELFLIFASSLSQSAQILTNSFGRSGVLFFRLAT